MAMGCAGKLWFSRAINQGFNDIRILRFKLLRLTGALIAGDKNHQVLALVWKKSTNSKMIANTRSAWTRLPIANGDNSVSNQRISKTTAVVLNISVLPSGCRRIRLRRRAHQ
jgi:hypothetical protein